MLCNQIKPKTAFIFRSSSQSHRPTLKHYKKRQIARRYVIIDCNVKYADTSRRAGPPVAANCVRPLLPPSRAMSKSVSAVIYRVRK